MALARWTSQGFARFLFARLRCAPPRMALGVLALGSSRAADSKTNFMNKKLWSALAEDFRTFVQGRTRNAAVGYLISGETVI
jgi:hypothetical protein